MDNESWTQIRFHTMNLLSIKSFLNDERDVEADLRSRMRGLRQQLRELDRVRAKAKRKLRRSITKYNKMDPLHLDSEAIDHMLINYEDLKDLNATRTILRNKIAQSLPAYDAQKSITNALKAERNETKGLLAPLLDEYNPKDWEYVTVMGCADIKAICYISDLPHPHELKFTLGLSLTETKIKSIRKITREELGMEEFISDTLYQLRNHEIVRLTRDECLEIGFTR